MCEVGVHDACAQLLLLALHAKSGVVCRELMFDLESTLGSVMPACLRDQDADPLTQLLYTLRRCTPDASFLDRRYIAVLPCS